MQLVQRTLTLAALRWLEKGSAIEASEADWVPQEREPLGDGLRGVERCAAAPVDHASQIQIQVALRQ